MSSTFPVSSSKPTAAQRRKLQQELMYDNDNEKDKDYMHIKNTYGPGTQVDSTQAMYDDFMTTSFNEKDKEKPQYTEKWYEINNKILVELRESYRRGRFDCFNEDKKKQEERGCTLPPINISNIIVRESQRRKGLAKNLILELFELAKPRHVIIQSVSSREMWALIRTIGGMQSVPWDYESVSIVHKDEEI